MTTVLKLGGELLEDAAAMRLIAAPIASLAANERIVVVHGGGRGIDAELRVRGTEPRFVDGLRITDAATLDTVICVLAGRMNTMLVAAINAAGARAVGLTGADAGIGLAETAATFSTTAGQQVDLGLVGEPIEGPTTLLKDLLALGYVPVVASVGVTPDGSLLNVNADTLAAHLAGALQADRLVIAGGTAGVLDSEGRTIRVLSLDRVDELVASGQIHSGMVAKLAACRNALASGVDEVSVVAGRRTGDFNRTEGTRIVRAAGPVARFA